MSDIRLSSHPPIPLAIFFVIPTELLDIRLDSTVVFLIFLFVSNTCESNRTADRTELPYRIAFELGIRIESGLR